MADENIHWTIWADTCVMLDFDTTISITKNGEHALEATRKLMQSAAWMAVAFDKRREVSVTAGYEAGRKMRTEAAPGSVDGAWTHMIAHVIRDHVCPNWHVRHTPDGEVTDKQIKRKAVNNRHDDFMIDAVRKAERPLVTSDEKALGKARRAGVDASRPEEYAARVIPFVDARALFMQRLAQGMRVFVDEHGSGGHTIDNLRMMWNAYEWMWAA